MDAEGKRMRRTRLKPRRATPRVVHSERTAHITGHKRVRLYGAERDKRRAEVFQRAGGRCEEMRTSYVTHYEATPPYSIFEPVRCPNRATEWSHMRHGANKCDCLDPRCNIASCSTCHAKRHNSGGKPCPPKPVLNGGSNANQPAN